MAVPFLFSIYVLSMGTLDHVKKSRHSRLKRTRDDLILKQIHLMHSMKDAFLAITNVQDQTCKFINACRSTLYLLEDGDGGKTLKATYVFGKDEGSLEVKPSVSFKEGIIGYAFQNRTPLLIEDIRRDSRFFGPNAIHAVEGHTSYRSGSCMIFPLASGPRLVGVLTVADTTSGQPFSRTDFDLVLEICASLALMLDNRQLQQALFGIQAVS